MLSVIKSNIEPAFRVLLLVRVLPLVTRVVLPRDDGPHVDAEAGGGGGRLAVDVLLVGVVHMRRPDCIALE